MIPALTNHLWQSTLFAVLAGLFTLALRKNRARVRYWVWMVASMKFAVPFSLLVTLGGHVSVRTAPVVRAPAMAVAIAQSAQAFVAPVSMARETPVKHFDPTRAIELVWTCGVLAVVGQWLVRWRRMNAVARAAAPFELDFPAPARIAQSLVEPGIFGIMRPMLLLPEGIAARLTPEQLRAILLHEASHVQRRDNLTAFAHMLVEAAFWFHPLVWWIGARLVEERERACDEEVLRLTDEPQTYAEGILEICKLYVESPLACVSGVTGADLKKRMEAIMSDVRLEGLSRAKRIVLATAAIAAIMLPIAAGIARAQSQDPIAWEAAAGGKMSFEAASVKLDTGQFRPPKFPLDNGNAYTPSAQFSADFGVITYIQFAYKTHFTRQQRQAMLTQLPKWIQSDRFAIEARADRLPTKDQIRLMMQSLLADRFQLKVHYETQETAVLALTLLKPGKFGPKLRLHRDGPACDDLAAEAQQGGKSSDPAVFPPECDVQMLLMRPGHLAHTGSRNTTMALAADALGGLGRLDREVVDQTGITERVDYELEFAGESSAPPTDAPPPTANAPDPGPTFLEALREQLGLKLEPAKLPLRVLVIDHIERPSEN